MLAEITLWQKRGSADPVEKSLAAWKLEGTSWTHCIAGGVSQADDSVTAQSSVPVDSTPAFAYGDRMELFQGSTRLFVGWARTPKPLGRLQEGFAFRFESPSRFLRSDYVMSTLVIDPIAHTYTDIVGSEIVLGLQNGLDSGEPVTDRLTVRAQVEAILQFGKDNGNAGGAAPFDFDMTGLTTAVLPEIGRTSASMLSCIDTILTLLPGIRLWWDYAKKLDGTPAGRGDNPVLRCVNTETIDISTGDAIFPPTLTGSGSPTTHTLPNDGSVLKEFTPVPQDERLIRKLTVLFGQEGDPTDFGGGKQGRPIIYTTYVSEVANGSPVEKVVTMQGRAAVWNGTAWVNGETAPAVNMARLLHQGFDRVWYDVSATTGEQNALHLGWRPCDLLCISGAGSDLAGAYAMIQSITRDLHTGEESITSGAPTKRGVGQLVAVREAARAQSESRGGGTSYGMKPPKPGEPGTGTGPMGPAGLKAIFHSATLSDDGGDPAVTVTEFDAPTNAWDLAFKNLGPLLDGTVTVGTTGGASSGSFAFTSPRTWKLSLYLNIPAGVDACTVDSVTTLAPGDPATASVSLSGTTLYFTFGIPKGDDGAPGAASSYTPANPSDWSDTAPTTIAEALDRIAAHLSPV